MPRLTPFSTLTRLFLLGLTPAFAASNRYPIPPVTGSRTPENIATQLCASCHGPALTGARAPNLLDAYWNHGSDAASIAKVIRAGKYPSGMPPFEAVLSGGEIDALVAYLQTQGEEFAAGRVVVPAMPPETTRQSERHAFHIETLASGLDIPWGLVFLPDGRILFTERAGRLRMISNNRLLPAPIQNTPKVFFLQDGGLLDVILHPDYVKNGWIYLAYSEAGKVGDTSMTVVVRGRIRDGRWVDEEEIFRAPPEHYHDGYVHYGCRFLFDEEGYLFFTIGDRGMPDEAQDLASPCGKIHRIFDDGRIPPDNPFANRKDAWGSIWTYGNRHAQGLSFHPISGKLWATEHGPNNGDELNRIEPGRNYGWPVVSHGTDWHLTFQGTTREGMESPVTSWTPMIAPSGIVFYTGDGFPNWKNHLFVAALGGERLLRLETDGDRVTHQEVIFKDLGRVRDVTTGPDGLLYVLLNNPGRVIRLVPSAEAASK